MVAGRARAVAGRALTSRAIGALRDLEGLRNSRPRRRRKETWPGALVRSHAACLRDNLVPKDATVATRAAGLDSSWRTTMTTMNRRVTPRAVGPLPSKPEGRRGHRPSNPRLSLPAPHPGDPGEGRVFLVVPGGGRRKLFRSISITHKDFV